jgi:hypothetical protein
MSFKLDERAKTYNFPYQRSEPLVTTFESRERAISPDFQLVRASQTKKLSTYRSD